MSYSTDRIYSPSQQIQDWTDAAASASSSNRMGSRAKAREINARYLKILVPGMSGDVGKMALWTIANLEAG